MKFACEQCKTKYSIADERVRGKILKIRCKHCSHVMTVRDESARPPRDKTRLERAMDQALAVSPSTALRGSDATIVGTPELLVGSHASPPPPDPEEWHISVDGVAHGPMRLEALAQRIVLERAAGDQEIYVWRDGFDDWQLPRDVPEVRVAVERLRPGLPPSFWGRPAPLFPTPSPRSPVVSTHPIELVESFEFTETPPTIAVPTKSTAALAQELRRTSGPEAASGSAGLQAPSPLAGVLAGAPPQSSPLPPSRAKAASPTPEASVAQPPPIPEPPSTASIADALAHLTDNAPPGTRAQPPAPSDGGIQLTIGEPSQMIDLRALASAVKPATSSPSLELPGLELPPSTPPPPVLVMTGPAPGAPGRHLKLLLGATVGLCLVLIGVVAYLLLRQPGAKAHSVGGDGSRAIRDRPVVVQDEAPVSGAASSAEEAPTSRRNGAAATRRAVRLPAAAGGKTQLNGNAQALAKLYQDDGGKAPALPTLGSAAAETSGGGVSTAELQEVVRRNQKSLAACYDRVLKHDESLRRARIDVQVRIGLSGMVTHVTIAPPYAGTELGQCMQQTIRRWHFPPSDSDYETQFPLLLTAN
ncbi:MAG: AgmX/PglI C-terminal domain-containing protein [Myxococcales bacterium]|nr:AgmX/PglI C-terminal domain-containing protein [Myxococcales bacterium]